ncbi:MAG: phospho-sugar mutase [Lachnospiraceae bacterium]|nr:phospho-sugar mutase [Lachnospiraceae bacterium]
MNTDRIKKEYKRWLERCMYVQPVDRDIAEELKAIRDDEASIEDAFYRDLAFGTGGLRGVIGAGTNRMNVYTVAKASQGLSDYVKKHFPENERKIAVSFDSRIKSDRFAQVASDVFAANGIRVAVYKELMPTPCLSYAVRALGCAAGVMITASHNPSRYNGYKVYGADGCQITIEAAAEIQGEIEKLDIFEDIKIAGDISADEGAPVSSVPEAVYTAFVGEVKKQSVLFGDEVNKNVSIVYSPLNGTGLKPVLRVLRESGYTNITLVPEQEQPDGNFPTCPYPNPEMREAMELGMEYAAKCGADLLLATDPDCDRVGIAVRNETGEYELLSGNETGMLLLDYLCSQRSRHGKMPDDAVLVKTIVTTDMAERIAARYGVRTVNVLTGFKYIGEQIGLLEKQGKEDSYLFGFEESCGYLSGAYVRDKDGVGGSFLICEMCAYYRTRGISLLDRLNELYAAFGYCLNTLHSFPFEGAAGFERMRSIMARHREGVDKIGSKKVLETLDYSEGLDGLPKSDVLKYRLDGDCSVVVRPSGTEPKLKLYISVSAKDKETADVVEQTVFEAFCGLLC